VSTVVGVPDVLGAGECGVCGHAGEYVRSEAPTREKIFRFVFERGDSQYLVADSERMEPFMNEITRLGGTLEPKGEINGAKYFLIRWPATGPHALEPAPTGVSKSS